MESDVGCLDYEYGWRLLLPLSSTSRLITVGLTDHQSEWWFSEFSGVGAASSNGADIRGGLFDVSELEGDDFEKASIGLDWVAAWGEGGRVSRLKRALPSMLTHVREYALIPPGRPRVVVPLSDSRNTSVALGLHRPGRLVARLAVLALRGLARAGVRFFLRRAVLLVATDPHKSMDSELGGSAGCHTDYGLYLGTRNANRKTVVLPLVNGRADRVLKISSSETSRHAIANEVEALRTLERSHISRMIPRVLDCYEVNGRLFMAQEYRRRARTSNAALSDEAVSFLAELSIVERRQCSLGDYLSTHCLKESVGRSPIEDRLLRKLSGRSSENIWLHRSHGDFTTWNCSHTNLGFFVFDWEESSSDTPALFDAFYFVIAEWVHLSRSDSPKHVVNNALQFAGQVAASTSLFIEDLRLYLCMWLLVCGSKFPRSEELMSVLELE